MKVFSGAWAQAYREAINDNPAYTKASTKWDEGKLALVLAADADIEETSTAVLLDLQFGRCLAAASVSYRQAKRQATFVIEGDEAVWRDVLAGNLQPLMALMRGKLKLSKGSITRLIPYTQAAIELVHSAQTVPTDF